MLLLPMKICIVCMDRLSLASTVRIKLKTQLATPSFVCARFLDFVSTLSEFLWLLSTTSNPWGVVGLRPKESNLGTVGVRFPIVVHTRNTRQNY